jgi:Dockerin type I domain
MTRKSRRGWIALGFAAAMVRAEVGHATTYTWEGGGILFPSGNWSTTSDWNPGGTPGDGDTASIYMGDLGGTVTYDYTGTAVTLSSLSINSSTIGRGSDSAVLAIGANNLTSDDETLGVTSTGQGVINQSGGVNTIAGDSGTLGVAGTYNLSGGSNSIMGADAELYVQGTYNLSNLGSLSATLEEMDGGTFSQSGGTNSATGLNVGDEADDLQSTYTLGLGNLTSTTETVYEYGAFSQSGGTNTIAGDSGILYVLGAYNLSGGTNSITGASARLDVENGVYSLSDTGSLTATKESIGDNYGGSFSQSGGTNIVSTLALGTSDFGVTGDYTQNGGTDNVTNLYVSGPAGTGYFLNDGSLNVSNEYLGTTTETSLGFGEVAQTQGTHTVGSSSLNTFLVGAGGTYLLAGGTLIVNALEHLSISSDGSSTFYSTAELFVQNDGLNIANSGIVIFQGGNVLPNSGGNYVLQGGDVLSNGTTIGGAGGGGALLVQDGVYTDNIGITLVNTGQLILQGGTVNTPTLSSSEGAGGVVWTGGTLGITGSGGVMIGPTGTFGDLTIDGNMALDVAGTMTVQRGYYLSLAGGGQLTVGNLSLDPLVAVDVANSHFFIDYGSNPDPVATIRSYLMSGYAGGKWTGPGIASSAAAGNPDYGVGYADSADAGNPAGLASGQIEVKYTLYGDTNLDGSVNSVDFGALAASFGKSGKAWDQGDFNYDGTVNSIDFGLLATNFGKSASGAAVELSAGDWSALNAFASANGLTAELPEPATILPILIAGVVFSRRRRVFS